MKALQRFRPDTDSVQWSAAPALSSSGVVFASRVQDGVALKAVARNSASQGWGWYGESTFRAPNLLSGDIPYVFSFRSACSWLVSSGAPYAALGLFGAPSTGAFATLAGIGFVIDTVTGTWRAYASDVSTLFVDEDTGVSGDSVRGLRFDINGRTKVVSWYIDGVLVYRHSFATQTYGEGGSGFRAFVGGPASASNVEIRVFGGASAGVFIGAP